MAVNPKCSSRKAAAAISPILSGGAVLVEPERFTLQFTKYICDQGHIGDGALVILGERFCSTCIHNLLIKAIGTVRPVDN